MVYPNDTYILTERNVNHMVIWERKILRKTHEPIKENAIWAIITNRELQEL